jgi:uncharacterized protein YjdB
MKLVGRSTPILAAVVLTAAAVLVGCDDSASMGLVVQADGGAADQVATLTVSPDSVNFVEVGDAVQLSATALDATGAPLADAVITWSSAELSVATVSGEGVVTAVGEGTTTVTAASGGLTANASVTVGLVGTP